MGLIRILTDRDTKYCGKLEQHDYEFYLGVNGIEHTKPVRGIRRRMVSASFFIKRRCTNFIKLLSGASYITFLTSYRSTWALGWTATIRKERIKEKCAATERPCRHSLTERGTAWKSRTTELIGQESPSKRSSPLLSRGNCQIK